MFDRIMDNCCLFVGLACVDMSAAAGVDVRQLATDSSHVSKLTTKVRPSCARVFVCALISSCHAHKATGICC